MTKFLNRKYRSAYLLAFFLLSLNIITFTACIKKNFDAPPNQNQVDPKLPVNLSLAQLQQIAIASGIGRQITGDSTVYGIVTLDDRGGNIYKEVIIQDSTRGMTLLLDRTYLYNDYPAGRKIYVKLKGLYIGTYHDNPELGYQLGPTSSILPIPSTLISSYVVGANYPNVVAPLETTLAEIAASGNPKYYYNRLVKIDDVEFTKNSAGQVYATPGILSSTTNLVIEDCPRLNTLNVHDYGYSNFQASLTPTGLGSITGVYQEYAGYGELIIGDTTGVSMTGARCPNTVSLPSPGATLSIDSLHKIGQDLILGAGLVLDSFLVHGVVTAAYLDSGNFPNVNYIIQDSGFGIALVYSSNIYPLQVGDSVKITVAGDSLVNNGSLQIRNISGNTNIAGTPYPVYTVTPRVMSIASIVGLYDVSDMQNTLVTIQGCTASPGGIYSGSQTLDDGSGKTITLVTAAGASFANSTISATVKAYTGIVSKDNFGNLQLQIRNLSDIH